MFVNETLRQAFQLWARSCHRHPHTTSYKQHRSLCSVLLQFAFGLLIGGPCLVSCAGCLTALPAGPRPPMGSGRNQIIFWVVMLAPLQQKHHDCFARSPLTHGSITAVCVFCAIKPRRVALLTSSKGFKYQLAENIGPQQCPLSAHSVPTQCPLSAHTVPNAIYWHIRMQEFNTKNFFLAFPNITVKCNGHCVGTEWALSGHWVGTAICVAGATWGIPLCPGPSVLQGGGHWCSLSGRSRAHDNIFCVCLGCGSSLNGQSVYAKSSLSNCSVYCHRMLSS